MSTAAHPTRRRSSLPLAARAATASAALALALAGGHPAQGHPDGHADASKRSVPTAKHLALHDDMRRLWEDHITWTRLFIVQRPARPARPCRPPPGACCGNQQDLGDAIKPFYGRCRRRAG